MLTKNDLEQIRDVVRDEVKAAVNSELRAVRTEVGEQIREFKSEIGTQMKGMEKRLDNKIRKVQNSIIRYHDDYAIFLRGRIEKLEEHTGILKSGKN